MTIKLLDCTLRDGAHVNGGNFGEVDFVRIIKSLSDARIDLIEIGFLQGEEEKRGRTYFPTIESAERAIEGIETDSELCLMIRPDRYDIRNLSPKMGMVSRIRVAFYLKDIELAITTAEQIRKLNYSVSFNPISITRYDDREIFEALQKIEPLEGETVSIVDTFGALSHRRMMELMEIFESSIDGDKIGLHLHENLASSFVFAQIFCERFPSGTIDGSLLGMGRSPGNLPIELICAYAIECLGQRYDITPILGIINKTIEQLKKKFEWGFQTHYMLSAMMNVNRNDAESSLISGDSPAEFYKKLINDRDERV